MNRRVEIILGNDGSIKGEVVGELGDDCQQATAFLDELFGDADEVVYKDEYYLRAKTGNLNVDGLCG